MKEKTVKLKIKRRDKPDAKAYWQEFTIPYKERLNVIACLQDIQRNPTTQSGESVNPVTWDCNCLEEVCGSCTMLINGKVRASLHSIDRLIRATCGSRTNDKISSGT